VNLLFTPILLCAEKKIAIEIKRNNSEEERKQEKHTILFA
jgi:hypothetical protein